MSSNGSSSPPSIKESGSLEHPADELTSTAEVPLSTIETKAEQLEDLPIYNQSREVLTERARVWKPLAFRNSNSTKCMVPGCQSKNCKLRTHQRYDPEITRRPPLQQKHDDRLGIAINFFDSRDSQPPSRQGVDGFPKLPIEETLDPAARELFHFFFTDLFEKLALLFRGPSVTNMHDFKERMLGTALNSELYCRCLILQSQIEQDRRGLHTGETRDALAVYNVTLTTFGQQLTELRQRPHPLQIELALLSLCSLMMYDNAHDNDDLTRLHWQGMRDLVTMRGGMHCVTMSLAYVIHADRVCAIKFDELPIYTKASGSLLPMPVQSFGSTRSTSSLATLQNHLSSVDPTITKYMIDVGRLVELWEQSQGKPMVQQHNRHRVSLEYLYYTRDCLDEKFTVLNSQLAKIPTVERCLLWTSRIAEYPCTWSNYIPSMTRDLSRKLVAALRQMQQDQLMTPQSNLNILLWMLFVLCTADISNEVHTQAVDMLRGVLDIKYNSVHWPHMWWTDEREHLVNFVWSSTPHDTNFKKSVRRAHEAASRSC